jgi:hypothetical protein
LAWSFSIASQADAAGGHVGRQRTALGPDEPGLLLVVTGVGHASLAGDPLAAIDLVLRLPRDACIVLGHGFHSLGRCE